MLKAESTVVISLPGKTKPEDRVTDTLQSVSGHADIELLLQEGKFHEAAALLSRRLDQFPGDRETELYLLLVNVLVHGPEAFEENIDEVRGSVDLNETEKDIVKRLFLLGHQAAEARGQEDQIWAYQRLLRRLLLGQLLDEPIPQSREYWLPSTDQIPIELTAEAGPELMEDFRDGAAPIRGFPQVIPILRPITQVALGVAVLGLLAIPAVYLVSASGQQSANHSLPANRQPLPEAAHNIVVTASVIKPKLQERGADQTEAPPPLPAAQPPIQAIDERPRADKKREEGKKPREADLKNREFARVEASKPNRTGPPEEILRAYKTKHRIKLREEPRFAATGIEELPGGTPVSVLEVRGKWLKVKSSDAETIGFVRKEFLTRLY